MAAVDPIVVEFEQYVQSMGGTMDDILALVPEELTAMLQQGGFNWVKMGRIRKYLDSLRLGVPSGSGLDAAFVVSEEEKKQSR